MRHLFDLRPCDCCDGPLTGGIFYVLRSSIAIVKARAVHEFAGMHQFFGGKASAALVENFAPAVATAVTVAMDHDEHKALMTELVICGDCYIKPLDLAVLGEKRTRALERAAAATHPTTETETPA